MNTINERISEAIGDGEYEEEIVDAIVDASRHHRIYPEHDRDKIVGCPTDEKHDHYLNC